MDEMCYEENSKLWKKLKKNSFIKKTNILYFETKLTTFDTSFGGPESIWVILVQEKYEEEYEIIQTKIYIACFFA